MAKWQVELIHYKPSLTRLPVGVHFECDPKERQWSISYGVAIGRCRRGWAWIVDRG